MNYNDNRCKKADGLDYAWCYTTNSTTSANQWSGCGPKRTESYINKCRSDFIRSYVPKSNKISKADEKSYERYNAGIRNSIIREYKKFLGSVDVIDKWAKLYEGTIDLPHEKRPPDWFALEYEIACRGKERCGFTVAVAESEIDEMTPKWVG